MNVLKSVVGVIVVLFLFMLTFSSVISCTKTNTVNDTIYKVIKDTIRTKDTIYDLKDGLVAYYNFVNGNLNDSSGHLNNIVFSNATLTADRFGNSNAAYNFSSGSYMRVNNSPSLNPTQISLMAIVKFNGYYTGPAWGTEIFMKGPADQAQGVYGIRTHPSSYDLSLPIDTATEMFTAFYGDNAAGGIASFGDPLRSGTWYTVIYTNNGSQTKIYVNGVLMNTVVQPIAFNANSNDLYIGKTENVNFPYYFTGVIDEIRIYNKPLSAQLIQQFSKLKY